ncbi:hypothetical protein LTR81_026275 [Elasticomyces elasticus]
MASGVKMPGGGNIYRSLLRVMEVFLRRRWLARVWTIREALLAQDAVLLCGDSEVRWGIFLDVLHCEGFDEYSARPAVISGAEWTSKGTLSALQHARSCGSTDPKDKVFAINSLLPERDRVHLDYGMAANDVYRQVAIRELSRGSNVLNYVQEGSLTPSWVPDWNTSVYPAMNPDNSAPNVRPEVLQNWKEWILKHLPVTSKLPLSPERHPWKFIPHFLGLRPAPDGLDMCIDRRLFNLQSGELGLGPAEARVGDYVCILLGARTPFVLRRYLPEALDAQHGRIDGPHDTAFTLVGECLVNGVMYGEALQLNEHRATLSDAFRNQGYTMQDIYLY